MSRAAIRVKMPAHLQNLAKVSGEVVVEIEEAVTQRSILDALEAQYPTLRGTMRDHATKERRPMVRFFACGEDWSHEPADAALPEPIVNGTEPFRIVGALAGG